jgi:hypothetical protein
MDWIPLRLFWTKLVSRRMCLIKAHKNTGLDTEEGVARIWFPTCNLCYTRRQIHCKIHIISKVVTIIILTEHLNNIHELRELVLTQAAWSSDHIIFREYIQQFEVPPVRSAHPL